MRILVSNDDGIYAKGLRVLAERLAREAENEVYVVAPDRERSATGHALTLHKPIRVEEVEMEGNVKGAWWTTGTPSDCVKFAVQALLGEAPDYVISGINNGPNLGSEILYSGTVSAAMEGAILNIPSMAVSIAGRHVKHFAAAAEFVARLVKAIPRAGLSGRTLLNINVPNLPAQDIKGAALTELGIRIYNDHYEKRIDPRGKVYYWLAGEAVESDESENSDVRAILHQKISVTPIHFDMTDHDTLSRLAQWEDMQALFKPLHEQDATIQRESVGADRRAGGTASGTET